MVAVLYILIFLKFDFTVSLSENFLDNKISSDFHTKNEIEITWNVFMKYAKWSTSTFLEFFQLHLEDNLVKGNISESCARNILLYYDGIKNWEPWAMKMFDATGKVPSGLMTATRMEFGSFDECLKSKFNAEDSNNSFQGKFCIVGFKSPLFSPIDTKKAPRKSYVDTYGYPPSWISESIELRNGYLVDSGLWVGLCLPSTCTDQEVYQFFSSATKPFVSQVLVSDCQINEPKEWPNSAILAMCIFATLAAICIIATVKDFFDQRRIDDETNENVTMVEGFWTKVLNSFSLRTNSAKVFEKRSKKHFLDCLNGIRFFLSLWVILSHVGLYNERWKAVKHTSANNFFTLFGPIILMIVNATLNMENFSVISGFLMVYTMKKKLEKNNGKINILEYILHKYVRLMPPFLFILVLLHLIPIIHSGPVWNSCWEHEIGKCRNTWLLNVLLVNNFLHVEDICMTHSWFMGMVLQMHIAGLILMIVTYRFPKIGIMMGSFMITLCLYVVYYTSSTNEIQMLDIDSMEDPNELRDFISLIYFKPYNHFPSFIIGMVLGWIILNYKNIELSKVLKSLFWISSLTIYAIGFFGTWLPIQSYKIIAIYYTLRTPAWGISTSWVLYSIFTKPNGFLNKFLSSEFFVPLSRISYCIYVIHPIVLLFRSASMRERMYMSIIDISFDFLAIIVISIGLAYITFIGVEQPFTSIYDLWQEKLSSKQKEKSQKSS